MQFNTLNQIESRTEEESKVKHFDPQKIFLYYNLITEKTHVRIKLTKETHPPDDEILKESKKRDKELGFLEELLKTDEGRSRFEEELEKSINLKGYYCAFDKNKQKGMLALYYTSPESKKESITADIYTFTSNSVTLVRATQGELGEGTLGVAYPGLGLIKVLDSLYGTDFDEVFRHEVNHINYPSMPEREIRNMTRQQCTYDCKYN